MVGDGTEARLSVIEVLLAEIKGQLSQMPKASDLNAIRGEVGSVKSEVSALRADVARIAGGISGLPSFWHVATMVIGTGLALWLRGALK